MLPKPGRSLVVRQKIERETAACMIASDFVSENVSTNRSESPQTAANTLKIWSNPIFRSLFQVIRHCAKKRLTPVTWHILNLGEFFWIWNHLLALEYHQPGDEDAFNQLTIDWNTNTMTIQNHAVTRLKNENCSGNIFREARGDEFSFHVPSMFALMKPQPKRNEELPNNILKLNSDNSTNKQIVDLVKKIAQWNNLIWSESKISTGPFHAAQLWLFLVTYCERFTWRGNDE